MTTTHNAPATRTELHTLAEAYRGPIDALTRAGYEPRPTTTGGNCAALEIPATRGHTILIADRHGPLPWDGQHDGWSVSRFDTSGRIGPHFTHDDDAIVTTPDASTTALLDAVSEVASWGESDDLCANPECDGLTDNGEGWNGYCGTCADRIEQQGGFD